MKIIITGATGFIGSEVLYQLLSNPAVTSVLAVSRRPLPETAPKSPKLQTIIHSDFTKWSEQELAELTDADACIWCLGLAVGSVEAQRTINLQYTIAAADAFAKAVAPGVQKRTGQKFRFIYTSGILAERDQEKSLAFLGPARKVRGEVENQLLAVAKKHTNESNFSSFVVRPAYVHAAQPSIVGRVISSAFWLVSSDSMGHIGVDKLAATMVDLAINNDESDKYIWENADMAVKGASLLKASN